MHVDPWKANKEWRTDQCSAQVNRTPRDPGFTVMQSVYLFDLFAL